LTLPEEGSSACLFVNGTLVHRTKEETPKCDAVSKYLTILGCFSISIEILAELLCHLQNQKVENYLVDKRKFPSHWHFGGLSNNVRSHES
jgi:hypothetical protein